VKSDIHYPVSSNHGVSVKCTWFLPCDAYCKAYAYNKICCNDVLSVCPSVTPNTVLFHTRHVGTEKL